MAWSDFKKSWLVNDSRDAVLKPDHTLAFDGDGDGKAESKMNSTPGAWCEHATYKGGGGTDTNPEVVTAKRGGADYVIGRSGSKMACYRGTVLPAKLPWSGAGGAGRPRVVGEGGGGTDPDPIWVAQEGGGKT